MVTLAATLGTSPFPRLWLRLWMRDNLAAKDQALECFLASVAEREMTTCLNFDLL